MQPIAANRQPGSSDTATGHLRFDAAGRCAGWNGSMPSGLPRPPDSREDFFEQPFLEDLLAHALRLFSQDRICSARHALQLLCDSTSSVTMELPGAGMVIITGFEDGSGGRSYVLAPCSRPEPPERSQSSAGTGYTLLHDAIQPMRDGISLWDQDGRLITCNPALAGFTGLPAEELQPGLDFAAFSREAAASAVWAPGNHEDRASELARMQNSAAAEACFETADGRIVSWTCQETAFGGLLLTLSDTTGQHQIEQAQREADLLVRTIVEASPTPFLVSRVEDGKILYCPPASRERFGKLETTLGFFLSPQDRAEYLEALLPTGHLDNYPVRFRKQDGSVMQGLTSARVIDLKGENVIVSSTRDMTEYLQMQDELEKQREIAHQNEKLSALGSLLAGVAHELNNPLSIVVGYALMLQDKAEDPVFKRRVERIGQAAERCTRIVRTFLAMARQRPMEIEHCSVNELIEAALEVSGYGLKSSGAEIALHLDPDVPGVDADPDQIVQVLTNLVVNAEHAVSPLGENGRVTLRTGFDASAERVFIEVADNGPGIDPGIQARIFEPFFTTKDAGEGTGVGLAFCHRIVTSHGGTLTVTSRPGQGASFRISLQPSSPAQTAPQNPDCPAACTARLKVLSIDDEEEVAELIADILQDAGYLVTTCNDPRQALTLLEQNDYDVVLSDMTMPGMDGTELLKEISARHPRYLQRLGFVTGNAMSRKATGFLNSNNCRYMEKPIAPQELLRLVEEISSQGGTKEAKT